MQFGFSYVGLVFLFMLAIGWQWVMEYEKEQDDLEMWTKK